jgi:NADH-quinone oxidoreductase subunit N
MNLILHALAPEILITILACFVLIADVYSKPNTGIAYALSLCGLLTVGCVTAFSMPNSPQILFDGSFIVDRFAHSLKLALFVLLAVIFIYSREYMRDRNFWQGEFFSLALFSTLGMMLVISSGNFLSLYLGLELIVLPLYAMIVFVKNETRYIEAAIKYFVIGSLGSGLLLYGISLIYGAAGSIEFVAIASSAFNAPLMQLGMLFVVLGIALEFGAVPFHMWLPDVYEGSPTTVTMIIATIPKIAVFALTYRLLTLAFPNLSAEWQLWLMALALASIIIGNLMALVQKNIKRMLAYSTISHIGFILLGLFAAPKAGYTPAIFYTLVYAFMSLAAFAVIMRLSAKGYDADFIVDYRGLNKTNPWLAFIMLLTMFSLSGVPPLVGFYAKLQILQAVINSGFTWIAVTAMIFTVIGAFYYLRVIREMYFEDPITPVGTVRADMSLIARVVVSGNGLLLLLTGIYPASLVYLCINMLR